MRRVVGRLVACAFLWTAAGCGPDLLSVDWGGSENGPGDDDGGGPPAFDPDPWAPDAAPMEPGGGASADPQVLYESDFENDDGGMLPVSPGSWVWGRPQSGPGQAFSGENLWATDLQGLYPNGDRGCIGTPLIELPTAQSATLHFARWLDTESDFDLFRLRIDNGSGNPITIAQESGEAIFNDPYENRDYDLAAWSGQTIQIQFCLFADESIRETGIYLDDVRVDTQGS